MCVGGHQEEGLSPRQRKEENRMGKVAKKKEYVRLWSAEESDEFGNIWRVTIYKASDPYRNPRFRAKVETDWEDQEHAFSTLEGIYSFLREYAPRDLTIEFVRAFREAFLRPWDGKGPCPRGKGGVILLHDDGYAYCFRGEVVLDDWQYNHKTGFTFHLAIVVLKGGGYALQESVQGDDGTWAHHVKVLATPEDIVKEVLEHRWPARLVGAVLEAFGLIPEDVTKAMLDQRWPPHLVEGVLKVFNLGEAPLGLDDLEEG